jgi:hypothetical protein
VESSSIKAEHHLGSLNAMLPLTPLPTFLNTPLVPYAPKVLQQMRSPPFLNLTSPPFNLSLALNFPSIFSSFDEEPLSPLALTASSQAFSISSPSLGQPYAFSSYSANATISYSQRPLTILESINQPVSSHTPPNSPQSADPILEIPFSSTSTSASAAASTTRQSPLDSKRKRAGAAPHFQPYNSHTASAIVARLKRNKFSRELRMSSFDLVVYCVSKFTKSGFELLKSKVTWVADETSYEALSQTQKVVIYHCCLIAKRLQDAANYFHTNEKTLSEHYERVKVEIAKSKSLKSRVDQVGVKYLALSSQQNKS